jgi:hypothetical protein
MAESKKGSKNAGKPQAAGGKQWQRSGAVVESRRVPILQYGQGNFHVFREALSSECLLKYGDAGRLIKLGKHYEEVRPTEKDFEDEADEDLRKALYIDAVKGWRRANVVLVSKRSQTYALIWSYMSAESQDEVRTNDGYESFSVSLDPEELWKVVVATHGVNSVSKVQDVMKKAAREAYWKCRQGSFESLVTYRANFDAVLVSYIEQGNADQGEVSNVMDFFGGLDNARYAHMKETLHNGWSTGDREVPKTVNQVYTIAANWI